MQIEQHKTQFDDIEEIVSLFPDHQVKPMEVGCLDKNNEMAIVDPQKQFEQEESQRTMQRRDRITYLVLTGIKVTEPKILASIANDYQTSTATIKQDILALCSKDEWRTHKHRLKAHIQRANELKTIKITNRKKEVADAALSFVKISESMLVEFSLRYDCHPKTLIGDISQLKSPNYFYENYMKQKPVKQKAKVNFMRLHISY